MNLDRVNNWLSLVANLGVLLGLIVLVLELQQNTNLSKSDAYRETIQEIADWRETFASNPALNNCYEKYQEGGYDSVRNTECRSIGWMINNIFGIYETAYFDNQYGFIGEAEWSRLVGAACGHYSTAIEKGPNVGFISDEFRMFLDNSC